MLSIFIRLAVVAPQISEILRKFELTAVQVHPRSSILVPIESIVIINTDFRIGLSHTVFEILTHFARKWLVFPPHPCLTPSSGGTPGDINVIYTPLKSTFNGLQFCRWQYGSLYSFSRCWLPSLVCEIPRNSERIWTYSRSRSSKVIDRVDNRKRRRTARWTSDSI